MDILTVVQHYGDQVNDSRTVEDIFNHADCELSELYIEIIRKKLDQQPGEEGIVGEAVDVILCMIDIINKETNNSLTNYEFNTYVHKKLHKWVKKYGEIENGD